MASAFGNTGAAGQLVLDVEETGYSVAENYSNVSWAFYLREISEANSTWTGGPVSATVGRHNIEEWWSGGFGFDWRPGGLQTTLIASGTNRVYHNADGTGQVTVGAAIGDTGTSAAGGPAGPLTNTIGLTTLTQVPNTPGSLSATRISDTQVRVNWANSGAANGQATQNQIQIMTNGVAGSTTTIGATGQTNMVVAANQKVQFRVRAGNGAGWSAWTGYTATVYTTPAAPSNVVAAKQADLSIKVTFAENVNYSEYNHEVWHGVVAGGVTTWDGAALTTLASGVLTYTHAAPNAAQVHIYRVRAKAGTLYSGYVSSGPVQLLIAPNKPTFPAQPAFSDRATPTPISWVHNSVDTSPQTAYEFGTSTDGGTTWATSGKVASSVSLRTLAANAYAANTVLTMRVRTWGSATTGGSDGTGASPWSELATVTFKTAPVASIVAPANNATVNDANLAVTLGFAQAQGASFVSAQLELVTGGVTVETEDANVLVGISMETLLQNGSSYTVRARVQDSNGLWSAWVTSTFNVTYLPPVPAVPTLTYLEQTGFGQLDIFIDAPGAGQSAATLVTITRKIGSVEEVLVKDYPVTTDMTFLDTTPTVNGTNTYTITTTTALGASRSVVATLVTTELRRAFLSKGAGFSNVVAFGGNLQIDDDLDVASTTIQAAGRTKPIGLYGVETVTKVKVKSFIFAGFGSTIPELRAMLLLPGKACYRDPSGRRIYGSVTGSVSYKKADQGNLSFTLTETS